jgi:hypothetical membrane protein
MRETLRKAVLCGGLLWVSSIQFFVAQALAQSAWTTPYSLLSNYISDLGNTVCAAYPAGSAIYVCSPWHALMNGSFILQGIIFMGGSVLTRAAFPLHRLRDIGLILIGLAGLGVLLVGFAPENVNGPVHRIGAALDFLAGNAGMVCLGLLPGHPAYAWLKKITLTLGIIGLVGLAVFGVCALQNISLGLGIGGWERVVAYPLPLWTILMGCSMLARKNVILFCNHDREGE